MTSKQDTSLFWVGKFKFQELGKKKNLMCFANFRDRIENDKMTVEIEVRLQKGFDRIVTYCSIELWG